MERCCWRESSSQCQTVNLAFEVLDTLKDFDQRLVLPGLALETWEATRERTYLVGWGSR